MKYNILLCKTRMGGLIKGYGMKVIKIPQCDRPVWNVSRGPSSSGYDPIPFPL